MVTVLETAENPEAGSVAVSTNGTEFPGGKYCLVGMAAFSITRSTMPGRLIAIDDFQRDRVPIVSAHHALLNNLAFTSF